MNDFDQMVAGSLSFADSILQKLEFATAIVGAIFIFLLMMAGVSEVLLRTIFNSPIPGYIEAVQIGMVAFAILPISYCYQRDGHLKMDLLVRSLTGRSSWFLKSIATFLGLAFIIIILPAVYDFFHNSFVLGDSTMNMDWPVWPSKLAALTGIALLLLRLGLEVVALLRMAINPALRPVALPRKMDPINDAVD